MPNYRFTILDRNGRERTGNVRAGSEQEVRALLRARLCSVKHLWEVTETGHLTPCFSEESSLASSRMWTVITLVGGAVFTLSLLAWVWPDTAPVSDHPLYQVRFEATGTLKNSLVDVELSELRLYGVLPDIFFEQRGELDSSTGEFRVSYDFESREQPAELVIELERGTRRWPVERTPISLSDQKVDLGTILVRPPVSEAVRT